MLRHAEKYESYPCGKQEHCSCKGILSGILFVLVKFEKGGSKEPYPRNIWEQCSGIKLVFRAPCLCCFELWHAFPLGLVSV